TLLMVVQALAEADLLDGQIAAYKSELPFQRMPFLLRGAEAAAQEGRELRDHALRQPVVALLHQHGNAVQGIEEEVRVELHLQGLQTRGAEVTVEAVGVLLEPRGLLPQLTAGLPGEQAQVDEPIEQEDIPSEEQRHEVWPRRAGQVGISGPAQLQAQQYDDSVEARQEGQAKQVQQRASRAAGPSEGPGAAQAQGEGIKQQPWQPEVE